MSTQPIMIRAPRRWWADVAGTFGVGSLVAVTALWVAGGGLQDLGGQDNGLTSAGRLAGLLSADLMLLQVLMMARIPWLERSYGQDTLARRHRLAGFWSFWLLIAHIVFITFGYWATSPLGLVAETWNLVTTYPGMLLAVAALAMIIMVVVTSIRAARRRLRYESWHLLHLYAYLGVGLALPHQIWTGTHFVDSAPARYFWITFYCATLAAVLVFRIGLPAWRTLRHRLVVDRVVHEAPGVVSLHIRGNRLTALRVQAGQFFLWRFLDGPGWSRGHPYSLSAAPRADRLRITVKDLGDDSAKAAAIRPGTRIMIEGPYGALTADPASRRPAVLLAAGVGITALRALIDDLVAARRPVTVLYRVGDRDTAVFRTELEAYAESGRLRLLYLTGSRGRRASFLPGKFANEGDARALRRLVPDVTASDAYLCGPPEWMSYARHALRSAGVPAEQIKSEEFAW
ncbi:ferredoxin reductase family protein [Hamadaea tsunoensis]|uniref:ferredoxin reductase family protein n=1 Tax=Hamadaea tsunoensis TaxID=53368 RepID=UPI00047F8EE3|nr:ferredoxin reductase family protein [Hamadaea tsunoensis]